MLLNKELESSCRMCISHQAGRLGGNTWEDVVTLKVAFQEKTQANVVSYLTLQYGCLTTIISCLSTSFFPFLILFLGTVSSWQVYADDWPPQANPVFVMLNTHAHAHARAQHSCRAGSTDMYKWQGGVRGTIIKFLRTEWVQEKYKRAAKLVFSFNVWRF